MHNELKRGKKCNFKCVQVVVVRFHQSIKSSINSFFENFSHSADLFGAALLEKMSKNLILEIEIYKQVKQLTRPNHSIPAIAYILHYKLEHRTTNVLNVCFVLQYVTAVVTVFHSVHLYPLEN